MRRLGLLAVLFAACGGGDSPADPDGPAVTDGPGETDGPTPDGPSGTFAITTPLYNEGGVIPLSMSCEGDNNSPQLDWTGVPANTQSLAIIFTDNSNGLIHSIIFDIPANLTGLPADVDNTFEPADVPGAKQTASYQAQVRGYNGPCPNETHTYEFRLYAMSVATLPGATMQTSRAMAKTLIEANDLADTAVSGMYTPQ